jgi:hypothetical protein
MINFLAFCFAASMAITAIHVAIVWDGMILHFINNACTRALPAWLKKPLYDCMICMASVYTTLFWFACKPTLGVWGPHVFELLFAILTVAGLNTLVCVVLDKLSDMGC